ncbi:GTP 3',8-cyclase [Citrifermentans bremense]|uniref:GTP 3',8-cyclase n=2 Tax=Geobacteraceae TaxID=213422 RepID=A0ABQ0ME42_9BACT|nr:MULTISPECIES: GTP 3',8-cyclase MoaA [Geobacteraceae]BCG48236.1 GTP 3',8-cyclase [Citrifermentans bremense]GAW65376.1 molybdenum cofactor biosynthesis protein MoeA [Geoanaerobacter pelophilus]
MSLIDAYGRRINYLRLSVTDRCNLRCSYCMPAKGVELLPQDRVLSYEELLRVATQAVAAGIEKIRVTGGEPLVRKGIIPFLERLARIPGLEELVLTTNGTLLKGMARGLKDAGVQRLNISLDSLDPATFARITRGGDLKAALAGIEAAERAGFPPHKINVVLMRGVNDHEILDFVRLTLERPYAVRFIEYMPTCQTTDWRSLCIPGSEVLERIAERFLIEKLERNERSGPAKNFRVQGAVGSLGVITPMTGHFCDACNRLRVTASGTAKGCLLAGKGVDLRPLLASGDDALLRDGIRSIVLDKPGRHRFDEKSGAAAFVMSGVGG